MAGYWHGDSYCMQLVLQKISARQAGIKVIVTADKRGDVIERMLNRFGAEAIRLPDGLKMRPFFRELKETGRTSKELLAASLDGPLGPLHEPKKLLFLLASEAEKEVVYLHFHYSRVLRLKNRWDSYVIPLPFSKITAQVESLGSMNRRRIQDFDAIKNQLIY
ncbi:MAG: hypothetical protein K0S04_4408 [Herbinix sp.]|jgi:lysophospholipid acyltransferase (LPLAT)-like uncharacterized protein|nr:hypothetical protein [Herbinix sp.]